jgi:hypothetical protein
VRGIDMRAPPVLHVGHGSGASVAGITPGSQSLSPRATGTPEERLADMDALGVGVKRPAVNKPSSGKDESPEAALLAVGQRPHHVRAGHRERQPSSLTLSNRGTKGDVVPVA